VVVAVLTLVESRVNLVSARSEDADVSEDAILGLIGCAANAKRSLLLQSSGSKVAMWAE